jgi:hypothetical protein
MPDPDGLDVHDVTVRDDVDFRPGSFGAPLTKVTFSVGTHGPFQLTYPKDQATDVRINSDIETQVRMLRNVIKRS